MQSFYVMAFHLYNSPVEGSVGKYLFNAVFELN